MKGKRILSAVLSAALLLQLSPLAAFAEDTLPLSDTATTVQTEPAPEDLAIDAQIAPEPTAETPAEPTAEPTPEASEEPTATPTPEPTAEPTATPAAEESAPDAAETPAPEPSAEPTAAPDPAAAVQALIDALPDEVTEDNAAAVEQALTDIDDAKQSLTDDELAGLDFSRYDAAANALLALWGEAPTDEVETLDNYQEPGKNSEGYYQITNESELRWFAQAVNGGKKSIKARLMNDITVDKNTQWTPIGTNDNRFEGTFDGNGKTITGLTCTDRSKDYVGLVGYANGATIQDVTVKGSNFNGNNYIGAVCGFISGSTVFGGTITGCTNSGSTVKGWANKGSSGDPGRNIGGIVGRAKYATVQRCVNTGDVTGINYLGGIVGCTDNATVQDCGNTGNVKPTGIGRFYGGITGSVLGTSYIYNCYNAHSSTADKIYGDGSCSHSNCYYLADDSGSSGSTVTGTTPKTQAQFASGEVAYLLQGNRAESVWGQTLTGANKQALPVLGGDKVYQSAPCPANYSNTQRNLPHDYVDGVCSRCGEHEPPKEVNGYYQITNQWQLYWFADQVSNKGQTNINAKLTADITLNSNVLNENGELNTGASVNFTPWTPIGTYGSQFTGTFDGGGYTIYGLYIDGTADYVGLFGCIGKNGTAIGTVKDVTLADSYVYGSTDVGGICGWNNDGTVEGCRNTGTVSGNLDVGGVCGLNGGTLQKCHNTGEVKGTGDYTGGVCGSNSRKLQECYNTGTVSGVSEVGGVCGYNNAGSTLEKCYNTGKVISTGYDIGGVCGYNNTGGTVNGCYNTGDVSGAGSVGSVCGQNFESGGTVENCYYLAGTSEKAVGYGTDGANCASKTELQFQNGDVAYHLQKDLGGTTQVWGQRIDTGTGETDKTPVLNGAYAVYPAAEGSICKRYSNTSGQTFNEHEYDEETRVCSRCGESKPLEKVGEYYEIFNQDQLRLFAELVNNAPSDSETKLNARLMANITMDNTEWTPIGTNTNPFAGEFDGGGKTITGLKCTDKSKDYVGLVGYASGAAIQNVTVQDAALNGNEYIGAVCGYITGGTITNCHAVNTAIGGTGGYTEGQYYGGIVGYITGNTNVTGCTNSDSTVNGGYFLGGIAGFAGKNTTVQRCFNSGAVTCKYAKSGGIVGQTLYATVLDCGNTGAVTKSYYNSQQYGGIVGEDFDSSTIQNCYNTDSNTVAKICGDGFCFPSNCYYLPNDTGSSGSTDQGITAKTQAQFASGEVAYLLQNGRTEAVWGQTLTEPNKQAFPVPGGEKVYQSAPCKSEYTNTESKTVEHVFDNGICKNCGQPQIAYTVTIPASVELGNKATITADGVTLPDNKQLNVKVADDSKFKVTLDGDVSENPDSASYSVSVKDANNNNIQVEPGNTVLTVESGRTGNSTSLTFNTPESTKYSGEYKGKVTFTVSVDDKAS